MNKTELNQQIQQALADKNLARVEILAQQAISENPEDAFGYYYLGEYLLQSSNFQEALPKLLKAVEIEPAFEYQLALAFTRLHLNEEEAAKTIFDKLLKESPNNADLNYALAAYYSGEMEDEKALEHLDRALKNTPQHVDALEMRAFLYQGLHQYKKALLDINQLLELDDTNTIWRNMRIELNQKLNDRTVVEADFNFLIKMAPTDIDYRFSMGNYYMKIVEFKEAEYCFSDVIDIQQRAGLDASLAYRNRGLARLRSADYYKAIEDFKQLMKLDEELGDAYLYIAEAYEVLRKPDLALTYLDIGLDIVADGRWRLYQKKGSILLELQDYDGAEAAFRGMTRDTLGQAEGFFQLGLLFLRQGDLEAAYTALMEADSNLHETAAEYIERYCQEFVSAAKKGSEQELMAEYESAFATNSKSVMLQKAFSKLWKLNEKATTQHNAILTNLPSEMQKTLTEAFKNMLFCISPQGFYIYNLGQEDLRALYSIEEEDANKVKIIGQPFDRASSQEMNFEMKGDFFVLAGFGTGSTGLDLYFSPTSTDALSDAVRKEFKEKEKAGNMAFLGNVGVLIA